MAIDESEVARIAHLARLELEPEEASRQLDELSRILGLVEEMNAIDTAGVSPMAHPLDATQRLRPDAVTETNRREELQEHAPSVEGGLYLVPKVID